MYVIYALIDPRNNTVHYVGQTNDVYARFQQHINGNGSFAKNAWIFELRAANKMVIMETLEETEFYQDAIEREAYWIKHFEALKEPLSNATHRASLRKIKRDQLKSARKMVSRALTAMESDAPQEEIIAPKPERDLTLAVKAWNAGYTSCRDLAKFLSESGIPTGKDAALRIIKEMRAKQLI